MIVMKFGGTSLASAQSLRRVVSIVQSELQRDPAIVASALGDTTDVLLELLVAARRGNAYSCWKLQDSIKDHHFSVASDLLAGGSWQSFENYLRLTFRDLHIRMLELCEGERAFTPELQDWTLSIGEQLSSRLLAAVFQSHCSESTIHLDARDLILTDDIFTSAQPRYWESYARIRWAVARVAREHQLIVIGGFIGSTDDGRTTTLGRGGSDLTASILGAALNAEEIQVWKDVDGMLTWDPRLMPGAHKVSNLSYEEANELAHAGATILHPDTIQPAKRLRIPITIRNTFQPQAQGTRIAVSAEGNTPVKSIAVKKGLTLLEISVANPADNCDRIVEFCRRHKSSVNLLHWSEKTACIAIDENASVPGERLDNSPCFPARVRSHQAIVTLVGRLPDETSRRVQLALQGISIYMLPSNTPALLLRFAIPQNQIEQCLKHLNREFFTALDGRTAVDKTCHKADRFSDHENEAASVSARLRKFELSLAMLQRN